MTLADACTLQAINTLAARSWKGFRFWRHCGFWSSTFAPRFSHLRNVADATVRQLGRLVSNDVLQKMKMETFPITDGKYSPIYGRRQTAEYARVALPQKHERRCAQGWQRSARGFRLISVYHSESIISTNRNPMLRYLLLLASVLFAAAASAAQPDPPPGNYVIEGDRGTLEIRKDAQHNLIFAIQTIGSNCHTCDLSGIIRKGVGSTLDDEPAFRCEVSFVKEGDGISVIPIAEEGCRSHCGARASFDGDYHRPPPSCTDAGRQKQHEKFLGLYRARRYAEAAGVLDTLAAQCTNFMNDNEMDRLRNDLALSRYHNGEFAQCVKILDLTIAGDIKNEQELKDTLPPCEFSNYLEIAKATWFNKNMCVKALTRKP